MVFRNKIRKAAAMFQELSLHRSQRLLQLSIACSLGVVLAALVSEGITAYILLSSLFLMLASGWLAWKKKPLFSATTLLLNLTAMLSALVWSSGGIYNLGMLGYPMVLVIAAMLGNLYLFAGLLVVIIAYCSLIAVLVVLGYFQINFPEVTYAHLLYVNIIFLITGFGVYLLVLDMHRLMGQLKTENERALERERTIIRLANLDQLTDLPNRRYAEHHFIEYLTQAFFEDKRIAILFLDLDNFKPVNDSLGHAAGDELLRELSQRLQTISSDEDMLCRFGGDEFLWIKAFDYKEGEGAFLPLEIDAERLLAVAQKPFYILENKVEISASVGIAVAPMHGETFVELVRSADLAMYDSKSKGRNTFSFYTEDLNRSSIDKYEMLKNIRHALQSQEFQVWYQPKIDLRTLQLIGCEALVRWPKADGSFIYPDQFIPLAESSGLISELGLWVLEQSCLDCVRWSARGFTHIKVAVNVSYMQLREGNFSQRVEDILKRTGMSATRLEIELTESLLVDDDDHIHRQLNQLNDMGVSLAIDDFGTGYSNLGYLRRFNARCLKIDRSFVGALGVSKRDEPLVKAIIQMAHSLGLKTIAEGVEDQSCLLALIELGCDEGQGYYWSPAMPYEKWMGFLQNQGAAALFAQPNTTRLQ